MTFFAILPWTDRNSNAGYLALKIDRNKGVETVPDMDITLTKLNKKDVNRYIHFFNNGYGGITFKVTILIEKDDIWDNKKVTEQLHELFINMTPLSVVTEAIDVPDGRYLITKNPSRVQNYKKDTVWQLEFTTYTPLALFKFKNDNSEILKAINASKKNNAKSTNNSKLSKCNYKTLVYSKKKKVVKCVKYMQKVLYKNKLLSKKQIDGWFGNETKKALKKFQKKWNKKNVKSKTINGAGSRIVKVTQGKLVNNTNNSNIDLPTGTKLGTATAKGSTVAKISGLNKLLPENGKVDKLTFKALCKS